MSKVLFTGLLAGALMVPQASISADTAGFRLPLIPYSETIPWLTGSAPKAPSYLGLLLSPKPHTTTQPVRGAGSEHATEFHSAVLWNSFRERALHIRGEIMETVNGLEPG